MDTSNNPIAHFSVADLLDKGCRRKLRSCLRTQGVFYLTGISSAVDQHEAFRELTLNFFNESSGEQKRAMSPGDRNIRRGYSGLEGESTASVTNQGDFSDYSMCYSMGRSQNLFPSAEFEDTWSSHFESLNSLAQQVAGAILSAMIPNESQYSAYDSEQLFGDPVMRFRFFPDVPESRVNEVQPSRMASHYDLSVLTLIHQTPCANGFVSLQVELDGDYIDLPAEPDALIVMCGAVARIVTEGQIPAPRHHVAAPPARLRVGSERTSTVFFLRPEAEFGFSVPRARHFGLDVCLNNDHATFGQWIGTNYSEMHTDD